jgi:hypothetical protein
MDYQMQDQFDDKLKAARILGVTKSIILID